MAHLMQQYKENTTVKSSDDETVGTVERVVIDPRTYQITHLIIEKGFLFPEERLLSVELVAAANDDRVTLNRTSDQLDLPEYRDEDFLALDSLDGDAGRQTFPEGHARPVFTYPRINTERGIFPDDSMVIEAVELGAGKKVITADNEYAGDVERVFSRPSDQRITHLLIAKGILFTTEKLVPVPWIRTITDDKIQLGVSARALQNLPEYEG